MNLQSNFPIILCSVAVLVVCCCHGANAQSDDTGPSRSELGRRLMETTAERNFDQLIEAISEYDGGNYSIAYMSAMQPSATGKSSVPFRAVLADRRLAKLHELFAKMPREEAAARLMRVYQQKLAEFKRDWEAGFQLMVHGHPDASRHGLTSTLFLCLEFGDEEQFDRLLQQWIDWYEVQRHTSRYLAQGAGPDELAMINFYAIALFKRGESVEEIDRRVQQLCDEVGSGRLPELRLYKLYKWNATALQRNDADAILAEFPVFINWGSARHLVPDSEFGYRIGRRAIAMAHDWVWPPNQIELWLESAWQRVVAWTGKYFHLE